MATGNFCFKNRCIVVTDEDYEDGNYPVLGWYANTSGNYSSLYLRDNPFLTVDLVLTVGYYEHACLDFINKEDFLYDYIYTPDSVDEMYKDILGLMHNFHIKVNTKKLRELVTRWCISNDVPTRAKRDDISDESVEYDNLLKYIAECELPTINAHLDKIKDDYGYDEVVVSARFSNGETIYKLKK